VPDTKGEAIGRFLRTHYVGKNEAIGSGRSRRDETGGSIAGGAGPGKQWTAAAGDRRATLPSHTIDGQTAAP